ncbi:uncharacterized protein LOC122502397 [Leptopilina heterotoma]|uniref:uncharacterized protein LOC122502397 n=1 Tax=Leptopilina heterotoma TaxID=63436 RepID=UPI001CA8826B|nr:uncharacterized protein LOC122502397 [Leptopilina heterotoma]
MLVEDLKEIEKGIELPSGQKIYGGVSAITGDNQAMKWIWGYKESYSAEYPCQYCLVPLREIQIMTVEDNQRLRSPSTHDEQLTQIEAAANENERKELSQAYGINRRAPLSQLSGCHPTTTLPPDIDNDLFLGVVPLHLKQFLKHFCLKKEYLTLKDFNTRIANFDYRFSEKSSKPSPIKPDHLRGKKKIKQTASQMWTLAVITPFIVFDKINNENSHHLENLIQLLEIIAIVCSPKISMQSLSYLESLIRLYLVTYSNIYKSDLGGQIKFTPKQHFLLHYPKCIKIFGPLNNFWTMRFEAKHQYFKRIVQSMRNWKNLPFTFAWKHQFRQSFEWIVSMENEIESGRKKFVAKSVFPFRALFPDDERLWIVKWIKFNGIKFVANQCYIGVGYENRLPVFAELYKIVWMNGDPLFVCKNVQTVEHNKQLMAYEIKTTENFVLHSLRSLVFHKVLQCHKLQERKFIIVKQLWGELH